MTEPATIIGPSYEKDTLGWLKARTGGVTATEVRDLAKGYGARRKEILEEKLSPVPRKPIVGNKYIDNGNHREAIIAAWLRKRFGIIPSDELHINRADPRWLATPDGVTRSAFGGVVVAEIKTSKHDLTPGEIVDNTLTLTKRKDGTWEYKFGQAFASAGYYDQMQWQMFVMGEECRETLFAYEQHDDDWSGWPLRAPKPLTPEPRWCWILRDDARIEQLVEIAEDFLVELEAMRRVRELAGNQVAEADPQQEQIEALAAEVVAARAAENAAKQRKAEAWEALQGLLADKRSFALTSEQTGIKVTVNESRPAPKRVFNRERALARAPKTIANYEALVERYTEVITPEPTVTLTVTAPK